MEIPEIPSSDDPKNILKMRMDVRQFIILVILIGGVIYQQAGTNFKLDAMNEKLKEQDLRIADNHVNIEKSVLRIQTLEDEEMRFRQHSVMTR